MSATVAGSRPRELDLELSIPLPTTTDGGLWVRQHQQPLQDQQRSVQDQEPDPAQPDARGDLQDQRCQHRPQQLSINNINHNNNELFVLVHPNLNSSSSDIDTPLTPTFSPHSGVSSSHLRYASSTSSLDLQQSLSTCSDSSASPTQPSATQTQNAASLSPVAPPTTNNTTTKRQLPLPDVQEEPLERDGDQDEQPVTTRLTDEQSDSLWNCLCRSFFS